MLGPALIPARSASGAAKPLSADHCSAFGLGGLPDQSLRLVDGDVGARQQQCRDTDGDDRSGTTENEPVISATMIMTASGARETLPKRAIIATTTKIGSWGTPAR